MSKKLEMTLLTVGSIKQPTVPTHRKHTHNKYFSHNKRALFALAKMFLFGEEEDFGVSLAFSLLATFSLFFKFENQESFSPKFQF